MCTHTYRFHVLAEFDQGKRSCRKRLAEHNRRRRKSQDLTMATITATQANNGTTNTERGVTNNPVANPERVLFTASSSSTNNNNNNNNSSNCSSTAPLAFTTCKPETESSVTQVSSPPAPPPLPLPPPATAPRMALGLCCGGGGIVTVPAAATGLSASSSAGTSPPNVTFLSHLGEFGGHENRFPSWDEAGDGSSIRCLYQST